MNTLYLGFCMAFIPSELAGLAVDLKVLNAFLCLLARVVSGVLY